MKDAKTKRIGIMGGTFDPIHIGHIRMGLVAKEALDLSEVWYMPSGTPAYKLHKQEVSEGEDRLDMLELAIGGIDGFSLSDIELKRAGNTYTSDTLTELKKTHPGVHFYFIVGGDSLDYMDEWHEAAVIFRLATIAAFPRADFSTEALREKAKELRKIFGARIRVLWMEPFNSSSTEIRRLAGEGKDLTGLVPPAVADYIVKNGLYTEAQE